MRFLLRLLSIFAVISFISAATGWGWYPWLYPGHYPYYFGYPHYYGGSYGTGYGIWGGYVG